MHLTLTNMTAVMISTPVGKHGRSFLKLIVLSLSVVLVVLTALALQSPDLVAAEIIAHRGASHDAPENTLAAVNLAWEQQADAVEIDVYLSKDDEIVVMHDSTPKRYGGPDRKVSEMTLAEVQALDVGKWKDAKFAGEKVPVFTDVLKSIPEGRRLFIEVKAGPEILPALKNALKQVQRPAHETCIISFNSKVIEAAAKELPDLQRYWLVSMSSSKDRQPPSVQEIIETAKKAGATGVNLGGDTSAINQAMVERLSGANLPCYAWTVNDPEEAIRLAQIGVQGITTDRPELLRSEGIGEISPEG
ncbi:glycerophosphodiester phosphodiesterase [Planctomicrobium sp. SH661]|uniref:glycerophosphodiester phosphodiesterase n=1 Tax=Planctomicrobium sp. SH661 TaxID=3448124 RepID=UPI003F5C95C2